MKKIKNKNHSVILTIKKKYKWMLHSLVIKKESKFKAILDFPGGTVDKNSPANAGDMGSISHLGKYHMPQSN